MSRFTQSQSEANKWNWTSLRLCFFWKVKQHNMIYWITALAVQPKFSEAKQLTNHAVQPQQLAGGNKAQAEVFNYDIVTAILLWQHLHCSAYANMRCLLKTPLLILIECCLTQTQDSKVSCCKNTWLAETLKRSKITHLHLNERSTWQDNTKVHAANLWFISVTHC